MQKIILVTGSTDGIGLETVKMLASQGHHVLLHGRNPEKLEEVEKVLSRLPGSRCIESYIADLSSMAGVAALAKDVAERHTQLDVLINNAGVFRAPTVITEDGLDVRFAVNTIAPYLLTQKLLPLLATSGRVINLSSAAQSSVDPDALLGRVKLADDFMAYAQSKLALTMWSRHMGLALQAGGPTIIAVNPGSMLGSKMVKEGFGVAGGDIGIGADILIRLALEDEFKTASGQYFENDLGRLALPHLDALSPKKAKEIVRAIEEVVVETKPCLISRRDSLPG